jgi:hypothetical protein
MVPVPVVYIIYMMSAVLQIRIRVILWTRIQPYVAKEPVRMRFSSIIQGRKKTRAVVVLWSMVFRSVSDPAFFQCGSGS